VCSGPRRGREFTYTLLEERVPPAPMLEREAALVELAMRYFQSHGPATARDLAWWSGLTVADVTRSLELAGERLKQETGAGLTYWLVPDEPDGAAPRVPRTAEGTFLLANYDEYTVAYKERDLYYDASRPSTPERRDDAPFGNVIVLAGRVVGMWKRTLAKDAV